MINSTMNHEYQEWEAEQWMMNDIKGDKLNNDECERYQSRWTAKDSLMNQR